MEKAKVFLLGMITAIGLMFLIGAAGDGRIGRYQGVGWSNGKDAGYFAILDTTAGQTYWYNKVSQTFVKATPLP